MHISRGRDFLSYTLDCDASQLRVATQLLAQAVHNLYNLNSNQVNRIRPLVIEEKMQMDQDLHARAMDHLYSVAYQQGSLGFPVQGTLANLKRLSFRDLSQLAYRYYTVNNITITATGEFSHKAFLQQVKHAFTNISDSREAVTVEPSRRFGAIVTDRDDSMDDVVVAVGYDGPTIGDGDGILLQLVCEILGEYHSSSGIGGNAGARLAETIGMEKLGSFYRPFMHSYPDAGLFGVLMGTTPKHVDQMMNEVCSELVRLAHNARPSEVARAKNVLRHRVMAAHDGVAHITAQAAFETSVDGYSAAVKAKIDMIDEIDVDRVREVCMRKFADTEPSVAAVGNILNLPDYQQIRGWTQWWDIA